MWNLKAENLNGNEKFCLKNIKKDKKTKFIMEKANQCTPITSIENELGRRGIDNKRNK